MNKLLAALAVVALSASSAQAQYSLLTARSQVGGTGAINWESLGAQFVTVSSPTSVVVSNTSLTATVSMPNGAFHRLDQGGGWGGNFDSGDKLLYTVQPVGPLTISFNGPIAAAGSNIQRNYYGAFTGVLHALDFLGNSLVSYNFNGESDGTPGTAIFVGVSSTLGNIYGLRWDTSGEDFAINTVSVNEGTAVPEPTSFALTALGMVGLGVVLRRRRSA